jgi:hypothetical protein
MRLENHGESFFGEMHRQAEATQRGSRAISRATHLCLRLGCASN